MRKIKYLGCFFLLCGILFFIPSFFTVFEEAKNKIKVEEYIEENEQINNSYLGILEIPNIQIKQGFYSLSSPKNTVDKNVQIIEGSMMPDSGFGCLILAAHSGNSKRSYFKNLYKLDINDIASIYYKKKKYIYKYIYKYQEIKDGSVSIPEDINQTSLILITCSREFKNLQDIYVFKLVNSKDII